MSEMITTRILKTLNEPGLEIDPEVFEKLLADDGAAGDNFGVSIALSGDSLTIVLGAFSGGDESNSSGSAYIFIKQTVEAIQKLRS